MGYNYQVMDERQRLEEMVERIEWLSPVHYEILEFFEAHDIWESPRDLAKNIDYHRRYVAQECRTLESVGILEQDGQTYRLTDRGRDLLAGELDADDIPDPR